MFFLWKTVVNYLYRIHPILKRGSSINEIRIAISFISASYTLNMPYVYNSVELFKWVNVYHLIIINVTDVEDNRKCAFA